MNFRELDQKAIRVAQCYLRCEKDLLEIIITIYEKKAFYKLGYPSLFSYATERLQLSPAVAYVFINVARKSHHVPELKSKVLTGKISIHKAKKITSVINKGNQDYWLKLAESSTSRNIEKKVALASPKQRVPERAHYVTEQDEIKEKVRPCKNTSRIQLQMGVSEKLMLKFRRAQDLLCQKQKKHLDLEETLMSVLEEYIKRNDPLEKAKRHKVRARNSAEPDGQAMRPPSGRCLKVDSHQKGGFPQQADSLQQAGSKSLSLESLDNKRQAIPIKRRQPLTAKIKHQVFLRDGGQCSFRGKDHQTCSTGRFLEIHHRKPIALGGTNDLENLQLICAGHHRMLHELGRDQLD